MVADHPPPGSLARLRQELERVDRAIVVLLAARLETAERAIRLRTASDRNLTDPAQERRVLRRSRQWARRLGVPEELVDRLFRTLLEEGKSRFRTSGGPGRSPVGPGLAPAPKEAPTGLRDTPRAKLVSVPTGR